MGLSGFQVWALHFESLVIYPLQTLYLTRAHTLGPYKQAPRDHSKGHGSKHRLGVKIFFEGELLPKPPKL